MAVNSPAVQRGNLMSRLRPPTAIANVGVPARPGEDPNDEGYDPARDMFDQQQRALEADAAKRKKKKNAPEDDEIVQPAPVTGSY